MNPRDSVTLICRKLVDLASIIEPERIVDDRGWFVRVFDADVFAAGGLCTLFPQHSEARNARRGTMRGLHYQAEPHGETKLIRCTRGAAYDVIVDVRPESATFGKWLAYELHADRPFACTASNEAVRSSSIPA